MVEDNNDVAETLGMVLGLDGHTVRIAPDGPSALESLRAFEPDAVLLDLGLPGMSGHEVARRVRQESNRENLLIVAVSGYAQEGDRQRSKEAGCDYHIAKPVEIDALRSVLCGVKVPELN